ncbi:MAG: metal ABC transporter permease [Muribaculaceae bacterium]|nr:metal ABC transporter permease [Muribaculaceae bacterium]
MLEFLEYSFFRNALAAVALIAVCAAMIGTYIITRRLVAISGGVTHACFGGLGLGYYLGINPVVMAGVFAIGSSIGVEWLSSRFRLREDSVIAVVWAIGMAIGVVFVFLTPGYVPELNSFLFGNILTVTPSDLIAFAIYTVILALFFYCYYDKIVICAFDRDFASVNGLPVKFINYTMTVLTAVCIVLTIRLVGVMLLMSMLSLPMMTAEVFMKRFKGMMLLSIAVSLVCSLAGLFIGTLVDVPSSAIIVMIMAAVFIIARFSRSLFRHKNLKKY